MSEIKLTLGNIPAAPDASAVAAAVEAKPVEKPAQPVFTPEEQKMIDDFSKQIVMSINTLMRSVGNVYYDNIGFSDDVSGFVVPAN